MGRVKYLTREDFERPIALEEEIYELEETIAEVRALGEKMNQTITGMPFGGSGPSDKVGNNIARVDVLEKALLELQATLAYERTMLLRRISLVPSAEDRKMLKCKFYYGMSIQESADYMGVSWHAVQSRQRNFWRRLPELKIVDPYAVYVSGAGSML